MTQPKIQVRDDKGEYRDKLRAIEAEIDPYRKFDLPKAFRALVDKAYSSIKNNQ